MSDGRGEHVASLRERIESLERTVRSLSDEVERLRARGSETSSRSAAPPPPGESSGWSLTPGFGANIDFESLIGRYGTLVLATITALAGVGTFLGWAISQGLLGPTQRIGLGLTAAAALAVGGLRLRRRERSFGASLLGLSLAIVHVCAWGAGPSLKLVPPWGAFVLAAAASVALAVFAHAEDDEPLWSVGFSGAAVAPFVTASGKSDLLLLAAYGIAVLSSAGYAMGTRRWIVAGRLFLLAAGLYTLALATGFEKDGGPLLAMALPLAVAMLGVVAWIDGWPRRERLRALGVLAALAALRSGFGMDLPYPRPLTASMIAAAGVLWLVLVDRTHGVTLPPESGVRRLHEGDWLDAGVLPLGFAMACVIALDAAAPVSGTVMLVGAGVLLLSVMRSPQGSLRDAAVFATVICALVGVLLHLKGQPFVITAVIAAMSALSFAGNLMWRSASWTTLGLIGFTWSVLATLAHLDARTPYRYTPFATDASAVALAVFLSLLVAWRCARDPKLDRLLQGGTVVWAFAWVHTELAFAVNPTVSTLLIVTYYAAASVAAVGIGRSRSIPLLRHGGLLCAILAAGTALYGARHLEAIGARITADLVAAVFLLAIAYWYRQPGSRGTPASSFREPASLA